MEKGGRSEGDMMIWSTEGEWGGVANLREYNNGWSTKDGLNRRGKRPKLGGTITLYGRQGFYKQKRIFNTKSKRRTKGTKKQAS